MQFKAGLLSLSVVSSILLSGCSSIFAIGEEEYSCPGREHGVICAGPRDIYEMTNTQDDLSAEMMNPDGTPLKRNIGKSSKNGSSNNTGKSDAWLIANFDTIEADAVDDPDDDTLEMYKAAVAATMKSLSVPSEPFAEQTLYKQRSKNRQHPDLYDRAEIALDGSEKNPLINQTRQSEYGSLKVFNTAPHDIAPEPLALLKPAVVMRVMVTAYKDDNNDLHMPGYMYVDLEPRSWIVGEAANTTPQRIIPLDIRTKSQKQIAEEGRRSQGVTGLGVGQFKTPTNSQQQAAFAPNTRAK
jgi:conjugal transfer pilus assembly protein TraV